MKKKMMKALRDLNAYVDDDRQKLCDRLHELELSHKRQEKLLNEVDVLLRTFWNLISSEHKYVFFADMYCNHSFLKSAEKLHQRIKFELSYLYYRVKWKTKGGKNV